MRDHGVEIHSIYQAKFLKRFLKAGLGSSGVKQTKKPEMKLLLKLLLTYSDRQIKMKLGTFGMSGPRTLDLTTLRNKINKGRYYCGC